VSNERVKKGKRIEDTLSGFQRKNEGPAGLRNESQNGMISTRDLKTRSLDLRRVISKRWRSRWDYCHLQPAILYPICTKSPPKVRLAVATISMRAAPPLLPRSCKMY